MTVPLTSLSHGAGCGCKLGPGDLLPIVRALPAQRDPNLLVGAATADDAGVYRLSDTLALVQTVDEFNRWVEDKVEVDPQYGRRLGKFRPLRRAPFFALQYFPMARKCFGGVRTDLSCRVVREDGSIIPGLYAAGEVAGMAGGHINGKAGLEGTMLGPSIFSGRVAGAWAAHEAGFGSGFIGKPHRPELD